MLGLAPCAETSGSRVPVSRGTAGWAETMGIPCEVITWSRFHALACTLARRIRASGFEPDIIVAIGRGGWMPGRILSDLLDLPDLTSFKIEHYRSTQKHAVARVRYPLTADLAGRRVLLVDDVTDSGDTFIVAVEHLRSRGEPADIRTAVLHHKVACPYVPDYFAHRVVRWRWVVYPWAIGEDVGNFVRAMDVSPEDIDTILQRLAADHGIRISRRLLADVLAAREDRAGRKER